MASSENQPKEEAKVTPYDGVEDVSHLNEGVTLKHSKNVEDLLEYLRLHPLFLQKQPTPEEIEKSTLLQALTALKYDEDDPVAYCEELKEEGNDLFKKKKYKDAIVSYTDAIKRLTPLTSSNPLASDLAAVFYTNRAASQYYLGNRRSAMLDATEALKCKPDHLKALNRLCLCFYELEYYEDCVRTCEVTLALSNDDPKISNLKAEAGKKLKIKLRNERKEKLKQQKINAVQNAIQNRGVKVRSKWPDESFAAVPVFDSSSNSFSWPITFFYPAYMECDFIESFDENCNFYDQLLVMFETPAPWDSSNTHTADNLVVYYEDMTETPRKAVMIKSTKTTLREALTLQQVVEDYHLNYFVLPKSNSKLNESFVENFLKFKSKFREILHSK